MAEVGIKFNLNEESISKSKNKEVKKFFKGFIYILPSLILFLIFVIYPFLKTIFQSFFLSNNLGQLTSFVGLENYIDLFKDTNYLKTVGTTFLYVVMVVPITITIALMLAVISNYKDYIFINLRDFSCCWIYILELYVPPNSGDIK